MKKILFLLLFTVSFYGQTLQNPTYGIVTEKNNATDSTPAYFVTSQTDGVHKKTPAANVENTANKSDSYTTSSSTTYASTKALVDGLSNKQSIVEKGAVNGYAGLNSSAEVYTNNLPKYVQPYGDILEENPNYLTTYENKFIHITDPLIIGETYRLIFKMKTNINDATYGLFTIHLRNLDSTLVQQTVWSNFEATVGERYTVDIVALAKSETFFIYCANFGGDIEISFEKVNINSGVNYNIQKLSQPLKDKKMTWFGTSTPAGVDTVVSIEDYSGENKYPSMVAKLTGATVYNEGIGGSRISTGIPSAYNISTDPLGIGNNIQSSFGFYSSLGHTLAEKDYIFDNWSSIYTKFTDAGSLNSTCPKTKEQLRDYSFERKLILNHLTKGNSSVFVLDHGFNDMFKIALSDGQDIPSVGSATERMYYSGSMNYIIRKIYESDPRNKIVIISHYRKGEPDLDKLYDTQRKIADYWQIPLISLADLMSINSISINTRGYWDSSYIWHNVGYTFVNNGDGTFTTNDYGPQRSWDLTTYLTYANPHQVVSSTDESLIYPVGTWIHKDSRLNFFCPDNVHPHSDLSGISNMTIAKIIASEINNGFQQSKTPILSFENATLTGTPTAPTATAGTNTTQIATTAFVQGEKAITVRKISTNTTLSNSDNGKVILLTASCIVTLPNGLMSGFNCSFSTLAGATLTYSLGASVVLINNIGTTMAEKLSHTIVNTGVSNEYLIAGAL